MSSPNFEDAVAQFKALTGVNESVARHFVKESNGDMEQAVAQYFEFAQKNSKPKSKVNTFTDEEEKKNDDDMEFFVGSGQNVIGPKGNGGSKDLVDGIFNKAQQPNQGEAPEEEPEQKPQPKKNPFDGMKGRSLGTTTVVEKKEENPVEQPKIEPILKPEIKEKTLMITFYKNGFQVDEGEFRSYENPENQAILKALNDGVVPQSLLPGVDRNTMISCQLVDKKSEIFEPPKESFKAFKGEGRSMSGGNVEKIEVKTDVQLTFKVDESKPVTTLQIRLPGGKAVKAVFNLHHTVSILRSYITSTTGLENFTISTPFPKKTITEIGDTLEKAGLKNASIIVTPQ